MSALVNTRREVFATELARGASAKDAYERAGYRPHRANASKLARSDEVKGRVAEILAEREAVHAQGTADAIRETALTKTWVIERLQENVERAMQAVPVLRDGKETGEFKWDGHVANRALELLGKELGMFVDRHETNTTVFTVSDEPMSEEDWLQKHAGSRLKH